MKLTILVIIKYCTTLYGPVTTMHDRINIKSCERRVLKCVDRRTKKSKDGDASLLSCVRDDVSGRLKR